MKYKFVLFGSVKTTQVQCPVCHEWQFQAKFCDCGESLDHELTERDRPEIRVDEPTWRERISTKTKEQVFQRDEFNCQYCGVWCYDSYILNKKSLTVDHMLPVAIGGGNKVENLVTCCFDCNMIKGSKIFKSFDEARDYIQKEKKNW